MNQYAEQRIRIAAVVMPAEFVTLVVRHKCKHLSLDEMLVRWWKFSLIWRAKQSAVQVRRHRPSINIVVQVRSRRPPLKSGDEYLDPGPGSQFSLV